MSENSMAIITGGIIAIFSFGLAVVWDVIKFNRESGQRDEAVLSAVKQELLANTEIMRANQSLLDQELAVLVESKQVVEPLNLLQNTSWDLLKIQLPAKLTKEAQTLARIRDISHAVARINETIQSRENYRVNNGAMSNFNSRMKVYEVYDQILTRDGADLFKKLKELDSQL